MIVRTFIIKTHFSGIFIEKHTHVMGIQSIILAKNYVSKRHFCQDLHECAWSGHSGVLSQLLFLGREPVWALFFFLWGILS
jgi:hypothetical protein